MGDLTVVSALPRVPIGFLTNSLDLNGPYGPGTHSLTVWDDGGTTRNVSDTFGVIVQINGTIPPAEGLELGYSDGAFVSLDRFEFRVVQVAVLHQLLTGAWIATQVEDVSILPWAIRWFEDLPGKIGLYVAPNWAIDLLYLKTI